MQKRVIAGALVLCAAACFVSFAQESPPRGGLSTRGPTAIPKKGETHEVHKPHATAAEDLASERAIRAQSAALIAEYNAKDPDAYAERFLPNAEYEQDNGEVLVGRPAIRDYFATLFEQHPETHAYLTDSRIRLISLHTAIQEGVASIADTPDDGDSHSPFVAIWVYADDRWRLASVREVAGGESDLLTAHEHLEGLSWLIGSWMVESRETATIVKSSCEWSDDGNFLVQHFTVKVEGEPILTGTQRIGWDPLHKRVRSWLFDSNGGFGEACWNFDGEKWVIRTSAVRHDGDQVASLDYLIPVSTDSYQWESSHRMLGDENLPDVAATVVRQPPPPGDEAEVAEATEMPADATEPGAAEGVNEELEESREPGEVRD
jgi:uncharacterized protein (TIGR02246 family)